MLVTKTKKEMGIGIGILKKKLEGNCIPIKIAKIFRSMMTSLLEIYKSKLSIFAIGETYFLSIRLLDKSF